MRSWFSPRRSPSTVVALLALFVALGGTSYAAFAVAPNSVGTAQLKDNAVTAPKIQNGAVTKAKLNASALSGYERATLPPDQTETGVYGVTGTSGVNAFGFAGITFDPPLAASIPLSKAVFLPVGTSTATGCPGAGRANPGFLCVYEGEGTGDTFGGWGNPINGSQGVAKNGTVPFWSFSGNGFSRGNWAVTAP